MSRFFKTQTSELEHNGNGAEPGASPLYGGATNGLPVAAPQNGVAEHADNGNGAGWTVAQTRGELEPADEADEELTLAVGDEFVGLTSVLESLLFVAGEPVEISPLAKSLGLKTDEVKLGLNRLSEQYKKRASGLRLQVHNDRYQLVTAPTTASFVEDFLNIDVSTKLSSAALETLAIVAYRQPVTRAQIEAIRGVDCSGVLRSLIARGLIEECGRLDAVGRPIVYGVTELFMQHFGLTEIDDLPPLGSGEADMLHAATALAEEGSLSNGDVSEEIFGNRSEDHTQPETGGLQ